MVLPVYKHGDPTNIFACSRIGLLAVAVCVMEETVTIYLHPLALQRAAGINEEAWHRRD